MISGQNVSALDQPQVLERLFHSRKDNQPICPQGAIDHFITVEEGVRVGARFFLDESLNPHILFFHGRDEIVSDYNDIGLSYNRYGLNFLVVDYRGYGQSEGRPTATCLLSDAHTILKEVYGWLKEKSRAGPFIVMGRELGSASALEIASIHYDKISGLILESAFARTIPWLNRLGVPTEAIGITEADGFVNFGKIKVIGKPTLIIHGPHDDIIPLKDADILLCNCGARSKELALAFGAGHNDILLRTGEAYFQTISQFAMKLKRLPRRPTKRRWFH
jgi:pimeloyl-ACP methyl ester carboxylesterase